MTTIDGEPGLPSLAAAVAAVLLVLPAFGQGPSGASVLNLGGGCSGACGTPNLGGSFLGGPSGGGSVAICCDFSYLPPTTILFSVGASMAVIDLSWLSPGCSLIAAPDVVVAPSGGGCFTCQGAMGCGGQSCDSGAAGATFAIPANPSLIGATAFVQFAVLSLGPPPGLQLSNALAFTFS